MSNVRARAARAVVGALAAWALAAPAAGAPPGPGRPSSTPSPTAVSVPGIPDTLDADMASATAEFHRLQEQANTAADAYMAAARSLGDLDGRVAEIEVALADAREEAESARSEVNRRAAAAYKAGGDAGLVTLLDSDGPSDFLARGRYLKDVVAHDRAVLRRALSARARLEDREADLQGARAEQKRLAGEAQRHRDEVDAALGRQGAVVARLERMKTDRDRKRAEAAARTLATLQTAVRDTTVPAVLAPDGLVCPIDGPKTFTNDWGAPRSGGRTHKGNDLFSPYGTPLGAVDAGVITKAGDDGGLGGLRVWLQTTSGHGFYYAHLSRVGAVEGQTVAQGDVVGAVGNSGNARTTPPHLHFQVHPGGGEPVNPYGTLTQIC